MCLSSEREKEDEDDAKCVFPSSFNILVLSLSLITSLPFSMSRFVTVPESDNMSMMNISSRKASCNVATGWSSLPPKMLESEVPVPYAVGRHSQSRPTAGTAEDACIERGRERYREREREKEG